ncbi:MAG: NAD-dependent epimerase/dehydratase family protein [Oceanipulchritudo sp.]
MKILVTGGGGFLGSRIVDGLLKEGHSVRVYQRSENPAMAAAGVEVTTGSLTAAESLRIAVRGCDAVIHTAAKAGVWGPRREYFATNVEGTRNLLEAMAAAGVGDLVHCSSPSVVFDGSSFEGADESLPYGRNWNCDYPESKALAEQAVLEWGRSGKGRVIALRPHLIVGEGDPHLLPRVIRRARSGRLRIVGDGTNRVDLTRVENAAAAHLLALKALDRPSAVNRPYFISQGEPVVLWEWINQVLDSLDIPRLEKRISLPAAYRIGWIAEQLWRISGARDVPPMTRFLALELAKSHWFSIAAAREELGYRPEQYPLRNLDFSSFKDPRQ